MMATAQEWLHIGGPISWAVFDRDWYVRTYPDVVGELSSLSFSDVLDFYLRHGQANGHSPNPFFDETWYLATYPGVADLVRVGEHASGFDHYCAGGYRTHSPHWLFDLSYYRHGNVDLTDAALHASGYRDHYNHYLRSGVLEGRIAHMFFAPTCYRAQLRPDPTMESEARNSEAGGAFGHFLRGLRVGAVEPAASRYFDPIWYRSRYPQVTEAIGKGEWRCALHHYLANRTPGMFDPLAEFSEAFYLSRYPDVGAAVAKGDFANGYRHFILNGAREYRAPAPAIDLQYYHDQNASAREAIEAGSVPDAFIHLLTVGRAQRLRTLPPVDEPPEEAQAKALFRLGAINLLPVLAREGIDFGFAGRPDFSLIMVVHNHFALTLKALASVRQNHPGAIELILVDSGSSDETRHIGAYVRGARIVAFAANIGYLRGCNAALNFATADAVLYLNNDTELGSGAIPAALRRLASDARIGAVGGKVIRSHGRLQEAGCIIWGDGSTQGYLRDGSVLAPEANFVREVDFCSAVFLLVRADLLRQLEGFDDAYAPAYFEDADLCVRIAIAGYRVVYDPAVVVIHLEYGTASSSREAERQMARCHRVFREKHARWLAGRRMPAAENVLRARSPLVPNRRDPPCQTILFIEDMPPMRRVGSGYGRSNDLIRVMVDLGIAVTVFPIEPRRFELAALFADFPDRVEILHDRTIDDLPEFLAARAGYYDVAWIGRTHNLDRIAAMLTRSADPDGALPRLILDTEAVASLREAVRATLCASLPPTAIGASGKAAGDEVPGDRKSALPGAIAKELVHAPLCERVIAVNENEAALLRAFGLPRVSVIGHMSEIHETPRAWQDRAGMLFVGAIHAMDSPNYDSLCWFVDEVLPLVESELRWETRLTIVGYTEPSVDLSRFADHARITLRGAIADLEPVYNQHRVFVAPTRFAAGIPYKIHQAASYGVPVVTTEMLREQLQWRDGAEILSAGTNDPAGFARHIVALSRSETMWQTIRSGAFARLRAENSRAGYSRTLRDILLRPGGPAGAPGFATSE